MAELPPPMNRTAAAIFARHERDDDDWRRGHLGASVVGQECTRHLWYSFRWASDPHFEGRMLRLFERGHREEAWVVEELRMIGMQVETHDTTAEPISDALGTDGPHPIYPQFRFEALGGHFGGGIDGKVLGVLEAPKTWHVLEVKTAKAKLFKELQKAGVRKAQPRHWEQMQCYMHGLGLKRALYVCVCKDDDQIYTERVSYDRAAAEVVIRRAEAIISAPEPLSKISEDPAWFECKFCDHREVCHLGEVERLERNCRTCASSTPLPNGKWNCEHWRVELDLEAQRKGCKDHLFIPAMLPWKPVNVDEERRLVTYVTAEGLNVTDTGSGLIGVP